MDDSEALHARIGDRLADLLSERLAASGDASLYDKSGSDMPALVESVCAQHVKKFEDERVGTVDGLVSPHVMEAERKLLDRPLAEHAGHKDLWAFLSDRGACYIASSDAGKAAWTRRDSLDAVGGGEVDARALFDDCRDGEDPASKWNLFQSGGQL